MNLGEVIKQWRWAARLDVRSAARIIGTSAATLSRIERGQNCDAKTLAKVLNWLLSDAPRPERLGDLNKSVAVELAVNGEAQ